MDKGLSKEQSAAIRHDTGPALVTAGPGSGKTTVITERIRYLVCERKVDPGGILTITFTNAAADEMKKRIGYVEGLFIGTIHAYALYLLSIYGLNEKAL